MKQIDKSMKQIDNKTTELKVRISPQDKSRIQRQAKQAGKSMSYYIRELLKMKGEGAAAGSGA